MKSRKKIHQNTELKNFVHPDSEEGMKSVEFYRIALSELLKREKLTQKELSERVNIAQTEINDFIRGRKNFSIGRMEKISETLNTDFSSMLQLGQNILMVKNQQKPDRKAVHKSIEAPWQNKKDEPKIQTIAIEKHKNLIEQFPDPEEGYDINKKLLAIKRLDPERFDHIKEYIDLMYGVIESKKIAGNDSE